MWPRQLADIPRPLLVLGDTLSLDTLHPLPSALLSASPSLTLSQWPLGTGHLVTCFRHVHHDLWLCLDFCA